MEVLIVLIISVLAGMATYAISINLEKGAVFASAIVTLVSGIVLPHFFPEIAGTVTGVAACASYAGMISEKNALGLLNMAIISLTAGILFITTSSAYIGIGGRLGTIGAIACFNWLGFRKIFLEGAYVEKDKSLLQLLGVKTNEDI